MADSNLMPPHAESRFVGSNKMIVELILAALDWAHVNCWAPWECYLPYSPMSFG